MSGSRSIDPRQTGRFDISRFREPTDIRHRHLMHFVATTCPPADRCTYTNESAAGKLHFRRGARRSHEGSSSSKSWQICRKRKFGMFVKRSKCKVAGVRIS